MVGASGRPRHKCPPLGQVGARWVRALLSARKRVRQTTMNDELSFIFDRPKARHGIRFLVKYMRRRYGADVARRIKRWYAHWYPLLLACEDEDHADECWRMVHTLRTSLHRSAGSGVRYNKSTGLRRTRYSTGGATS